MKISTIIPAYNAEKYIEQCIKSVLNQKYKNLEIIVIDDGSKDNTKSIVEKLSKKDSRVKLFSQKNSGVSAARNYGVRKATGDYIHFIDADDIIKPGLYNYFTKIVQTNDIDIFRFDYEFDDNGIITKHDTDYFLEERVYDNQEIIKNILPDILNENIKAYVWQLIIKKEKIIQFDEKLRILEDFCFYIDTLQNTNSLFFSNKAYYLYNIGNINSATQSLEKMPAMIENMLLAHQTIKEKIKIFDSVKLIKIFDSRMAHSFANYIEVLYKKTNDFKKTIIIFEKSIKNIDLKEHFVDIDYSHLKFKHKLTTFLTMNKRYFLLKFIYKIKRVI